MCNVQLDATAEEYPAGGATIFIRPNECVEVAVSGDDVVRFLPLAASQSADGVGLVRGQGRVDEHGAVHAMDQRDRQGREHRWSPLGTSSVVFWGDKAATGRSRRLGRGVTRHAVARP
jgi:hypothetical protein